MDRGIATLDDAHVMAEQPTGFGAMETPHGRLPLIALDVRARIVGLHAEVSVTQTYRNSLEQALEATYIFPLPDRAALTRFQMRVKDRTIEGQLKERGQARQDYEAAIQQGHRAGIAEEDRSGVFTLRVGNIPPKEEVTVELFLVQPIGRRRLGHYSEAPRHSVHRLVLLAFFHFIKFLDLPGEFFQGVDGVLRFGLHFASPPKVMQWMRWLRGVISD